MRLTTAVIQAQLVLCAALLSACGGSKCKCGYDAGTDGSVADTPAELHPDDTLKSGPPDAALTDGPVSASCPALPHMVGALPGASFTGLAVDDTYVYLAERGIWRLPKTGGTLEHLIDSQSSSGLLRDGQSLYWFARRGLGNIDVETQLLVAPTSGGPATVVTVQPKAGEPGAVNYRGIALAASGNYIYLVLRFAGAYELARFAKGTTTAEFVADLGKTPGTAEVIADNNLVLVKSAALDLFSVGPSGTLIPMMVNGGNHFRLDGDHVYWTNGSFVGGRVLRAPRGNLLAAEDVGALPEDTTFDWIVDRNASYVYLTDDNGAIARMGKAQGKRFVGLAAAGSYDDDDYDPLVAVDDSNVYWLAGPPGMRAANGDVPMWLLRICK